MVERLVEMGATVHDIEIPELDEMRVAQVVTILAEMAANMAAHEAHWDELSPSTRVNLLLGQATTSADYLQAQRVRTRAIGHFRRAFEVCDVILSPATARPRGGWPPAPSRPRRRWSCRVGPLAACASRSAPRRGRRPIAGESGWT